uniref:Uncharacterized protein n=1 Tax=Glossina austeni TaxID=7395 RepID=A0A1A9VKT1_GLOAU
MLAIPNYKTTTTTTTTIEITATSYIAIKYSQLLISPQMQKSIVIILILRHRMAWQCQLDAETLELHEWHEWHRTAYGSGGNVAVMLLSHGRQFMVVTLALRHISKHKATENQ